MRAGVSDSDISELSRPMSREAVNRLVFRYIRRLVRSRRKFDRELLGEIGESYHLVMEQWRPRRHPVLKGAGELS